MSSAADPSGPARRRRDALDTAFYIALVLKGLDALLEVVGGVLLLVVSPDTLDQLARHLVQHELAEDPHDFFARHVLRVTGNLHDTQLFGALYLLIHGLVKIVLVVGLWRRQRWAYPFAFVVLGAFIVYQLYRMTYDFSIGLLLLTLFDVFIVWLTWREYKRVRRDTKVAPAPAHVAPEGQPG
jgi:uncharacterized membrane protein